MTILGEWQIMHDSPPHRCANISLEPRSSLGLFLSLSFSPFFLYRLSLLPRAKVTRVDDQRGDVVLRTPRRRRVDNAFCGRIDRIRAERDVDRLLRAHHVPYAWCIEWNVQASGERKSVEACSEGEKWFERGT